VLQTEVWVQTYYLNGSKIAFVSLRDFSISPEIDPFTPVNLEIRADQTSQGVFF